jgi:PEP-CTERM motif
MTKKLPLVLCLFAFALLTLPAYAGAPTIGLGDPNCSSYHGYIVSIGPSGSFTFTSNSVGGGFFAFCNNSGAIFRTVDIRFFNPDDVDFKNSIDCSSTVFSSCEVTLLAGNIIDLFFSNPQTESEGDSGGIPNDHLMTINLNTPGSNGGDWPAGLDFFGQGNGSASVPEPASILLLSTGLLALWGFRRRS